MKLCHLTSWQRKKKALASAEDSLFLEVMLPVDRGPSKSSLDLCYLNSLSV